jgi:molybdopterin-binding protein
VTTTFRVRQAAEVLGVSDDTVRRWVDSGRLPTTTDDAGRMVVEGAELARFAQELAAGERTEPRPAIAQSARNHFRGLVTKVVKDTVMAQVELQAGPFRVVSLMSREAADELGLEPGVIAVASVKSTSVTVQIPSE